MKPINTLCGQIEKLLTVKAGGSCNLLAVRINSGLDTNLLLCLVSKLNKLSSLGLEPRTVFWCCGLCSCNLYTERNKFGLGTILLSCLVSKLQKHPSPGLEPRILFWSFGFSKISSFQSISMPSWDKSLYPFSSYKRTYINTHNFNVIYKKTWVQLLGCEKF
jgi:hypothetical protein